jgi:DNA polymerase-3 subunit epsilon
MIGRLKLERPIVFLDLETTGLNIEDDRIVEFAFVKVMPDGERLTRERRLNPGRPIPASATAIHGISDADVANCPTFRQVAKSLHEGLIGCDYGGFNLESFDLKMLAAEFKRAGLILPVEGCAILDAKSLFHQREKRDLASAVRFYCGRELHNAHSALADIEATIDVFAAQLDRYADLPSDVAALHEALHPREPSWFDGQGRLRWSDDGRLVVGFGKNQGRLVEELARTDASFLRWMLKSDFSDEVKQALEAVLDGRAPRRGTTAAA